MQTIRTFVAFDVSSAVRHRATSLIERLRVAEANVRWVSPENVHLTLKFLGDVPNTKVPAVCAAVQQAARKFAPIAIHCQGAGAFPDAARARTLWFGVRDETDTLAALQRTIDDALAELGFSPQRRRFHPHLTIGRVRSGGPSQKALGELVVKYEDFAGAACELNEVIIIASFLERDGATYDVLGRAPLMGATS